MKSTEQFEPLQTANKELQEINKQLYAEIEEYRQDAKKSGAKVDELGEAMNKLRTKYEDKLRQTQQAL